jgi:hypothetical protein
MKVLEPNGRVWDSTWNPLYSLRQLVDGQWIFDESDLSVVEIGWVEGMDVRIRIKIVNDCHVFL